MDSFGVNVIEMAALGRPFQLGMLYDCRKDALIPGMRLLDKEQLQQSTHARPQVNTDFKVTASDSIEEKSKLLNIDGGLKLSVLGGLINVTGSAKYLNDTKTSYKQQRLTLRYHSTTKYEELTMSHLPSGIMAHYDDDTATHVVTAVEYGADACFVFDREVSADEDEKTVAGDVQAAVEKLQTVVSVGANVDLSLNDTQKTAVQKFSCTFYGDFQLPTNPTTFEEALRVFTDLPKLLGENRELAVPLRIKLYPLDKLYSRPAHILKDISRVLITDIESVIESLNTTEMKCSDLLKDTPALTFAAFCDKIQHMKQYCYKYKLSLMEKLGCLLPKIRGDKTEDTELNDLLQAHEDSPFRGSDLEQWLKEREKESGVIKTLLRQLKESGATVEDNLDDILMDLEVKDLVSYTFTSLDWSDVLLTKQKGYLNHSTIEKNNENNFRQKTWLTSDVKKIMRRNLKVFINLITSKDCKPAKFIVASKEMSNNPGSCILLYEDGCDEAVCFIPPSKPACPITEEVKGDRGVFNVSPSCPATVELKLLYKINEEKDWRSQTVLKGEDTVILTDLRSGNEYQIKCAAVGQLNYTIDSDVNRVIIETDGPSQTDGSPQTDSNRRLAHSIKDSMSSEVEDGRDSSLPVFKLNLMETWQNRDGYCRRSTFGKNTVKENKTIMMIGATGAGKTTLINSMINYVLGVKWEDDFRFVLIDEGKQKSQAESQTSEVTAYEINYMDGFQVPYTLTIVDTPGFGDTRGISQDQKITAQIQEFFSQPGGIDQIDAVCFVVQASLARLTHTQKYVFDSILSIFGKDIADNILVLVTFADGNRPPVLEAIKVSQVPCSTNESGEPLHFKFNNSALFVTNNKPEEAEDEESDDGSFDKMYWKMGFASLKKFFNSLNMMKTKSLSLTREVLKERKQLEVLVQGFQPQINAGLTKLADIKKTKAALEQNKAEMEANKDFEYELEVSVPKQIKNTTNYYLTNCQVCHFTCHDTCGIANDKKKYKCSAMKDGRCTVCSGKCVWDVHFNQKYKWDYVTEKKTETYHELKKRFEEAHGEVMSKEKIFKTLEMELAALQEIVFNLIKESKRSLERLQEIALKPNPLSTPDYIDLMIESEKQEAKPGFQDRIQSLMEVRKQAEITSKVCTGEVFPKDLQKYEFRKEGHKQKSDGREKLNRLNILKVNKKS